MKRIIRSTLAVFLACTLTASAAGPGIPADLRSTTVPGTRAVSGTLDTTDSSALRFEATGQPDISIPYAKITEIHVSDKTTLRLGILPAIVVFLIAQPIKHHTLAVTYRDGADALQVVSLELDELQRNDAVLVLEGRSKQACLDRGEFGACQPILPPPRTPLPTLTPERSALHAADVRP